MTVWLVHHVHNPDANDEDVKLIGIYSSRANADDAAARLSSQPGFNQPDGRFEINSYEIDEDNWREGFVAG